MKDLIICTDSVDKLLEEMANHYEVNNPAQNATMDECRMMVLRAFGIIDREENGKPCGGLNYEAELEKAKMEICKLKEKCQYWEMRCDELDRERHFLGAQMDVVRLIFGGRNGNG